MENIITIEERVSSALDSYLLIENLKSKETLSEEDTATIERNIEHIKIILQDQEFVSALTKANLTKLKKHI